MSQKKVFVFFTLALFAAILIIHFVLAATPAEQFSAWLKDWKTGDNTQFNLYTAQFMFFLLVTLIIYSVADSIPFLDSQNVWLKTGVAAIISFLSTYYLAPEEVYTALMGYSALGVTLTTIVPVAVLLAVSAKWYAKYPQYSFLMQIAWIAFGVAYFIRFGAEIWAWWNGQPTQIGGYGVAFVLLTGGITLAFALFGGVISRYIFKKKLKGLMDKAVINSKTEAVAHYRTLEAYKAQADPETAKLLETQINDIKRTWSLP